MPPTNCLQLVLFTITSLLYCTVCAQSVSPIAEIRTLVAEKALHAPSTASLARLKMNRLTEELQSIDPHARYIPPNIARIKPSAKLRIGLDIFEYKRKIWVTPEPGGPAAQLGVPEVGELRAVNKIPIRNNLGQASTLIDKAIADNRVQLDIYDGDLNKYSIKPAAYKTSPVTTKVIGTYVFIRISDFVSRETAPYFSGLYNTLDTSDSRIIIDLRGCPGGDLFEALEIAGMFVPAGLPMLTAYDRNGKAHAYTSPAGVKLPNPLCILMDNRTASAAEILAGILKKNSIGHLIGKQSHGKCDSQTIFNLSNGGELWLTTLAMHFSDETSCTPNGVQPDSMYPDISIARLTCIKNMIEKL